MKQTGDQCLMRLQEMANDAETWDLSPNDREALAWAVDVLKMARQFRQGLHVRGL